MANKVQTANRYKIQLWITIIQVGQDGSDLN